MAAHVIDDMRNPLFVLSLITFIVFAQLGSVLFQIDQWPFTCYPMFSDLLTTDDIVIYRVVVALRAGGNLNLNSTNWPSIDNFPTRIKEKEWAGVRDQVMEDFLIAQRSNSKLNKENVLQLKLFNIYHRHGEKQALAVQERLIMTVDPNNRSFALNDAR